MVILAATASTSIMLAAFYRVTQLPNSDKRHHIYCDNDGEALPAEQQGSRARATRILMALYALATFLLSAWNWAIQEHVSGLAIITIAWVSFAFELALDLPNTFCR
jgi:fatty acid desaturase